MRPRTAVICIIVFAAAGVLGSYLLNNESLPPLFDVTAVVIFLFAPLVINAGLVLRHEDDLNKSEPFSKQAEEMAEEIIQDLIV